MCSLSRITPSICQSGWVLIHSFALLIPIALLLVGCEEIKKVDSHAVRSVKTILVGDLAGPQQRQFAGVLVAARVADLSFAVPGTVDDVLVERGMAVSAGQVLARLDTRTYELALSGAQARLASARAELEARELNFERQRVLREKALVARAALDQASAELGSSRAQRDEMASKVAKAQQDLERTALIAAYEGTIATRNIEPFQEVAAGQSVLTLESVEGLLAEVLVPESLIREVDYGKAVQVRFPTLPDVDIPATISEIGSRIEAGNAFPVRARIDMSNIPADTELRPGLSTRVVFDLSNSQGREVNLIPLSAVALGQKDNSSITPDAVLPQSDSRGLTLAPVYVFDPESQRVRKVSVLIGDIRGNLIEVYDGLNAGDRVIVAGVAFLRDGMPVRLWNPEN